VLDLRPELLERRSGLTGDIYRLIILVPHAVLAPDLTLLLDLTEDRLQISVRNADGDDDLARAVPGSPDVVAVVAADGFGEPVLLAEEVYGPASP
jgi:hypothetical protein